MIDLVVGILHYCASCVADNNVIPPAVGALAGAAGAAGGMGGLSGLQGEGNNPGVPPDGPGVPAVNAGAPPVRPAAPPGQGGGHGNAPAAPASAGPSVVNGTYADGRNVLSVTWPDGTVMDVTTDQRGRQTITTINADGLVTTVTGQEGGSLITTSGYTEFPDAPTTTTTETAGGGLTQTVTVPVPGGGVSTYTSVGPSSVSTGFVFPGGGTIGTTTESDGQMHDDPPRFDVVPPRP